jgi:hypothetical protein
VPSINHQLDMTSKEGTRRLDAIIRINAIFPINSIFWIKLSESDVGILVSEWRSVIGAVIEREVR